MEQIPTRVAVDSTENTKLVVPVLDHTKLCPACKYNVDVSYLQNQEADAYRPLLQEHREGKHSGHQVVEETTLVKLQLREQFELLQPSQ
jgi:hypothetical protein